MTDAAQPTIRPAGEALLLSVAARPGASRSQLLDVRAGALRVAVQAPPEKGKANKELIAVLAKALGLRRAQLALHAGHGARSKTVRVEGLAADALRERIRRALEPALSAPCSPPSCNVRASAGP